jgi:hypothetical protein
MKALSTLRMRHTSTQVDFQTSSANSYTEGGVDFQMELGTLYNRSKQIDVSLYNPGSPSKPRTRKGTISCSNSNQQYTSRSHNHNLLVALGTIESNETLQESMLGLMGGEEHALEFELPDDVSPNDDVTNLFSNDDEAHRNVPSTDVLLQLQEGIDIKTKNNLTCITREDKACIALEDILMKANAPLYLYDKIMLWACQHKSRIPSKVPYLTRKKLYNDLSWKIYGNSANDMKPKEILTTLPSGWQCGLTVFNVYSQIVGLLGNANITVTRGKIIFLHRLMITLST